VIAGIAQTAPLLGDVASNVQSGVSIAREAAAAGARFVLFPELSLSGYHLAGLADPAAWVTVDDLRLDPFRVASQEHDLVIIVSAALRGERNLLAAMAFLPSGALHVYGKQNLHGPERDLFSPGEPGALLDIDGWQIALAICYDAGVPGHAQACANRGAEIYAAPVLYTQEEVRRFDLHFAARAMDHRMYALAANHAGHGPGWQSCGGSGVWHPGGHRSPIAGDGPELVIAELSRPDLEELRAKDAQAGYPRVSVR
jgi:predicted amidohydrolase